MINKLKRKFITSAMIAIGILLFLILGTINIVNFQLVTNDADRVIDMITKGNGEFNQELEPNDGFDRRPMGPDSPETKNSVRFFTIEVTDEPTVIKYQMNAYSIDEAIELAKELSNKKGGWIDMIYRYRTYEVNGSTYVTIIDQGREMLPSYRVLIASVIGSIVGLAISFCVLLIVSKKFVKPIEDSDNKQKKFIASASNELKTPLTVIDLDISRIEESIGKTDEVLSIEKQTNKLMKLSLKLNDLVMLENNSLEKEEFNISIILKDIINKHRDSFNDKKISIEEDIEEDVKYNGDVELISKLLFELVENSCKYGKSYVKIKLMKSNDRICLDVSNDTENGNYKGSLDQVFEKFYKERKDSPGDGLGLAVSKDIVKVHNGRIIATGSGNEFSIKVEL